MNKCNIYLLLCSILWSISPFFYKKAGEYNKKKDKLNAIKYLLTGFSIGMSGTLLFILSTSVCKTLTKSVTYTYALPILFNTIISVLYFKNTLPNKNYLGIGLIVIGLYLI